MSNPSVPQYITPTDPNIARWVPGNSLPDIVSSGTLVTVQGTLDALVTEAAAQTPPVLLSFSATAPPSNNQTPTEAWRAVTTPPVSGTAYQNTQGVRLHCSVNYTPGSGAGDIKVELSPDGVTYRTWLDQFFAGSAAVGQVPFPCPTNWRYKITLVGTGAALGAINAIG